jgi:putative ABC transport system permease protein
MIWFTLRLILYNRVRLLVTLVGVVFSSYLTLTQVALYVGMMGNATTIIRNSQADLWIASKQIQNFEFANLFPERRVNKVRALQDVLWAKPILLIWGFLKLSNGAQEQVEIIGYDPVSLIGGPWEMEAGNPRDVRGGPFIILDASARLRLGKLCIGSTWELNERRVRLVGISRSAKTFSTAPVVFTSYEFAQDLLGHPQARDLTAFIAVKLHKSKNLKRVVAALAPELRQNEVMSTNGFVRQTVFYWTAETGMGAALCLTALLGLIVGAAVIGQMVFANTMEHLAELATLKAIGANHSHLYAIILCQASTGAVTGYGFAVILALISQPAFERLGMSLVFGVPLIGSLLIIVLLISSAAALFSIQRVRRVDPGIVFRS